MKTSNAKNGCTPQSSTSNSAERGAPVFTPRVDILETEHEMLLHADLPGVKPDEVDVRFDKGELTLHARCPARFTETKALRQEYRVGDYYRAFTISEAIDPDKITAELKKGVLNIHLPKREAVKPKKIGVQA
jgi:HSP20 family protein